MNLEKIKKARDSGSAVEWYSIIDDGAVEWLIKEVEKQQKLTEKWANKCLDNEQLKNEWKKKAMEKDAEIERIVTIAQNRLNTIGELQREIERIEGEKTFFGMDRQELTSICLKCGIDLSNCICETR